MEKRKKGVLCALCVLTLLAVCGCASWAAKIADAYWSSFDTGEGMRGGPASGFVVVDAVSSGGSDEGIGPFRAAGPSLLDEEVILEEGTDEETSPDQKPVTTYWREITIGAGDTLSKIAEVHGIAIKDIMRANELTDEHRLREGQVLFIPDSPERVLETLAHVRKLKSEEIARRKRAEKVSVTAYVVKDGDSLWSVANAFDLDVNTLYGSNKIPDSDLIKPGMTLRIPNQDGVYVKVLPNQTVEKLAKEYNIFPEAILSANDMQATAILKQGQEIFLPGAKVVAFVDSGNGKTVIARRKASAQRGLGWPVVGKISSSFGWRRDPVRGGRDFHTGLDIRAPRGRAVVAAASGTVVYSGWMGGYGRTIVISHPGGMTTLYGHNSKLVVPRGRKVQRGTKIAQVGSTGRSTGNHVHFEVRKNGRVVNPIKEMR